MTWNCEGLGRNIFNLRHFAEKHLPDLIFLSEPQIHSCNLDLTSRPISSSYSYSLNTADKFDPELPLIKSKAHGGVMVLWKKKHDPYVKVSPASSSAFLPILFHPPGSALSIHIGVYLPTMGLENQFMEELAKLSIVVEELGDANPNTVIFLRGDFNVSKKNKKRTDLLNHFCYNLRLLQTEVPKPTYHHFQGGGSSDSFLDRILFSDTATHGEVISSIECKLTNPLVNSHHDIIFSDFFIQVVATTSESSENIVAPKVVNERLKVLWSDPGIKD